MTSPVDTSVKHFSSVMTGAPVLNGTAGSLVALLDACLKDGFDTKTLTSLIVAGGVATALYTGTHSALVDAVVLIAGVTGGPSGWAGMNGEQKITSKPGATSVTFATALPDGAYTGTITMKMAPAGWLKPFAATNFGVYKSANIASTGMCLRVDDSATTVARVVGYESMSDVNTGVGPFPTAAQISGGGYWPKSSLASATAAGWFIVADDRAFLIHFVAGLPSSPVCVHGTTRGFGDAITLKPGGDPYACFLNYSVNSTSTSAFEISLDSSQSPLQTAFPRGYVGVGSAVLHACMPYTGSNSHSGADSSSLGPFPSQVDGSLKLSRRFFASQTSGQPPRADCPGLLSVPQSLAFDVFRMNDRVAGGGLFAGRNLVALNTAGTSLTTTPTNTNAGAAFVDITGPWR